MRIGILQTGHVPEELISDIGEYPQMFARLLDGNGFEFVTYAVVDGQHPERADDADGWLITGSRHGAYEEHSWIPPLEEFIRSVHADGRPMVGICFGHQIIAQALGGTVEKFDGGWSVGRTTYDMDGEPMALNAWHQDQVVTLPEGAAVVGSSDFCANAALTYGDSIYTIQPHPEFDADVLGGLIRIRGHLVPPDLVKSAVQRLSEDTNSDVIVTRIAEFFLKHREG